MTRRRPARGQVPLDLSGGDSFYDCHSGPICISFGVGRRFVPLEVAWELSLGPLERARRVRNRPPFHFSFLVFSLRSSLAASWGRLTKGTISRPGKRGRNDKQRARTANLRGRDLSFWLRPSREIPPGQWHVVCSSVAGCQCALALCRVCSVQSTR